jgi:uncharacterized protein
MRIAILSDTHNRYQIVESTLKIIDAEGIKVIVHCGDIEDVETVNLFRGFSTHFVFGNCDSDKLALRRAMEESGAQLHEPFGNLEMDGVRIAWTHGDDKRLLRDLQHSAHYDFLFYGHTHVAEEHPSGRTRIVNPGALHRACPKTFVLLDLARKDLQTIQLDA